MKILKFEEFILESNYNKPYSFYLMCDKLCNLKGVEVKNKMVADAKKVSKSEFIKNCNYAKELISYEEDFRDDPDHGYYKSFVGTDPCYYIQYAGFEFIFTQDKDNVKKPFWLSESIIR